MLGKFDAISLKFSTKLYHLKNFESTSKFNSYYKRFKSVELFLSAIFSNSVEHLVCFESF